MTRMTERAAGAVWGMMLAALPAGVGAQTTPAATATPVPAPTPTPTATAPARLQGLDDFSLPSDRPTPAVSATPTPVPPATPRPAPRPTATPTPRAEPTPRPSASPAVRPSPAATPGPLATPTPAATPTVPAALSALAPTLPTRAPVATPTPLPTASPSAAVSDRSASGAGWWWIAGGLAILAAAAWAWSRRRRRPVTPDQVAPDPVQAAPVAAAPPPAPPSPRARLEIELLPRRGGLTLISLVFEGELLVRNAGDAAAAQVAVEASLIPARSGQDEELGALFARPVARPAVAPFALAPGEERRVRLVAALPLGGVEPLVAGGRSMIVPVLAANVLYAGGEGAAQGQTAASWIVGVARPGSDKLAPFWLDAPGLSDALAARPHALAVTR